MADETLESNIRLTATDESGNALQAFATKLRDTQAAASQAIVSGVGHEKSTPVKPSCSSFRRPPQSRRSPG
jgi:hypothetical protein